MKLKLPNGFGSICKLTGKRRNPFIVRKTLGYTEEGIAVVKIVGYYPTYPAAMEALLEYNNDPALYDNKKYTFSDCYSALCKEKFDDAGKDIPPTYLASYKRCEPLHSLSMQSIRIPQIDKVIKNAKTEATQSQTRTLLNQVFKFAMRKEIISKNPVTNAFVPSATQSEKHQPFTEAEIKSLWSNTNDIVARYWLIYIYSGVRPVELVNIETKNVHLDEGYMIGGVKTTFGKNRWIPIADCIKPFIAEMLNKDNKYLIRPLRDDDPSKPMTTKGMAKKLKAYNDAHNLKHLPHDSRHTCATMLNNAGVNLTTIQLVLGQKPITVAEKVYIHRTLKTMLEAVNLLPHY